jgi:predicted TIM-barrel fold metal-dependent hydrolase
MTDRSPHDAAKKCLCFGESILPVSTPITGASSNRRIVDVHHHFIPPFYLTEYREHITGSLTGAFSPAWSGWRPQWSIDAMDRHGVETAMLSLSTPGVWFGELQRAREASRRVNEYSAQLGSRYSGRFGSFATIPLPDIEGSLHEISYALDELKADGICLLSSYDNKWLGDVSYRPVFEELDRRGTVVFVHPTVPNCCKDLIPGISPMMIEAIQDTTRAITSLLFSGAFTRFRNIKFIFCHAGGSVPMVAARMTLYGPKNLKEILPDGVGAELQRLFYDIAVSGHRPAVAALEALVPVSQMLFGSDFPYRPIEETADSLRQLGFSEESLQAIGRQNAISLFPRLGREIQTDQS